MSSLTIEQVEQEFSKWRASKSGPRVPDPLRKLALELKSKYGERTTRQALRLSSGSLWNWAKELSSNAASPGSSRLVQKVDKSKSPLVPKKKEPAKKKTRVQFVEITPSSGSVKHPSFCQAEVNELEWERPDGTKFRAKLHVTLLQLEELAARFLVAREAGETRRTSL